MKPTDKTNKKSATRRRIMSGEEVSSKKKHLEYFKETEELTTENAIKNFSKKTPEEIIKSGTVREKAFLYISDFDINGYFGEKATLTEEQKQQINNSLETPRNRKAFYKYLKRYDALRKFGRRLSIAFKSFQVEACWLASLVNRWDEYEKIAGQLTKVYHSFSNHADGREFNEQAIEEMRETWLRAILREVAFDGAKLCCDPDGTFKVDISAGGEENSLEEQIRQQEGATGAAMVRFKTMCNVLDEWDANSGEFSYIPISIQMTIDNAQEERFVRYLVKNPVYLQSELNYRIREKEKVTPEEWRRAVFPDYFTTDPNEELFQQCKEGFRKELGED